MQHKREILQKLTGVESSRKTYYHELNLVVDEMKRKNKQLEIINRLTKLQVDADWTEVSLYLAEQLAQLIPFDRFILTLVEKATLFSYITQRESWQCGTATRPLQQTTPLHVQQLNDLISAEHPGCLVTSVALQGRLQRVFGFLTLLQEQPTTADSSHLLLFQQIAEHVSVSVENMLLFKDVSEKVKIEAQLIQSAKMAAIGEMAAGVAHELNSPLTAILGNIQLLMRMIKTEPHAQMMHDIYQCGVRSKKIIQNLLTFSRQEEYSFERLNMDDLVEDVLGLIGYQLTVSGVTILQHPSDKPLLFSGSRHQIEQIIINLLLNARDALQGVSSPTITIHTFQQVTEDGSYVGLSVHDNGSGIKQEDLPQIFHPFFTTKDQAKGTGLGLSVSLGIAEAHNGKLTVESEAGSFSRFTLLLPT
ncbi:ATP-binding protein [Brevibacillus ruminantium]|uniref:histidine kinase n=1 Tax=Brevibacillus ruminantium TaxID=2950604 RepID=A0ABY4WHT5_9BACL|nr:ATP-binding protein [Brevibacillus ruminantium]USG66667.1 ATP-binding protein [Brevibacillus ruminantium]